MENLEEIKVPEVPELSFEVEDVEESGSFVDDVKKLTDLSSQYEKTEISKEDVFIDPTTGEVIDRTKLPPLEQIKIAARSLGQTINDPDKSCKKCHGRGYTGINSDGNVPVPCSCIYKEYYKNNPSAKDPNNAPVMNRRAKRYYDKQFKKYISSQVSQMQKKNDLIEKSKKNLGKNKKESDVSTAE